MDAVGSAPDLGNILVSYISAHPVLTSLAALWVGAANILAPVIQRPGHSSPLWTRLLYAVLIDLPPRVLPARNPTKRAVGGTELELPPLKPEKTAPRSDGGFAYVDVLLIVGLLAGLCGLVIAAGGCTASRYQTGVRVRSEVAERMGEATDAWLAYSKKRQAEINARSATKAEARAALDLWRATVAQQVDRAVHAAEAALVAYDGVLRAIKEGKKGDLSAVTATVWQKLGELYGILTQLNLPIELPDFPLSLFEDGAFHPMIKDEEVPDDVRAGHAANRRRYYWAPRQTQVPLTPAQLIRGSL